MEKTLVNQTAQIRNILMEIGYTDIDLYNESSDKTQYTAYIDADVIVTLYLKHDKIEIYDQYLDEKHSSHIKTITYDELIKS